MNGGSAQVDFGLQPRKIHESDLTFSHLLDLRKFAMQLSAEQALEPEAVYQFLLTGKY